ncbi:MAG: hypothetical protein ABW277_09440 [Longimicrobiaceae bacterium]
MPKMSWEEAGERAESRLGSGAEKFNSKGDWILKLTKLANDLHDDDDLPSESTTAVARMGNTLYVARQGGKLPSYDEEALKVRFTVTSVVFCPYPAQIDGATGSGLHAEMVIVRYVLMNTKGMTKKLLAPNGFQVGVTKGCCLDCAGWLNEQAIPHTPTNGKPSLMWRHPMTLSLYRHYNTKADNDYVNLKFYKAVGGGELLQPK